MSIDFPPALGRYWSAILLALAAIVFLLVGAPTKDAVAGAGFAFFGAAATRMIDIARERREETAEEDARRRRDLDETRRLAYMALVAGTTEHPELVATIANGLAHHESRANPDEVAVNVAAVIRGKDNGESRRWLLAQVELITAELDRSLSGKWRSWTRPYVSASARSTACASRLLRTATPTTMPRSSQAASTARPNRSRA